MKSTHGFAPAVVALSVCVLLTVFGTPASAEPQAGTTALPHTPPASALDAFSSAVEAMVQRVSPAVVQIKATRLGLDKNGGSDAAIGLQQSIGSGVVVGREGYIMTNAHVVEGAHEIRVKLVPAAAQTTGNVLSESFVADVDAVLIGTYAQADLALLKIAAENLQTLPVATGGSVRQGQVTFAFGSPGGLQNSVTMGVVSSIARQLEPDDPMLYIQTDTPINPGNSGGPLVNTLGQMVGLNTFISSHSGGSEGIGFAIPSALVDWVYQQLRAHGQVHRPVIGAGLQTITPTLAAALKLPRSSGVIVSDLAADGPATLAGLKMNDVVVSIDGRQMDNVAAWTGLSFQHVSGSPMSFEVLRDNRTLKVDVTPVDIEQPSDHLADLSYLSSGEIASIGIMAVTLDEHTAPALGPVRVSSGVIVVAVTANQGRDLRPGDLIHAANGRPVVSVEELRSAVADLKAGEAVAFLVERSNQWFYVAFKTS